LILFYRVFIVVCVMGITAGLVVVFRGIPAAFAGLALAHANQLSGILQNTVRWASETELVIKMMMN
jgi:ATP-binding cassette subfamily C (CFTR/MRP) protein 5